MATFGAIFPWASSGPTPKELRDEIEAKDKARREAQGKAKKESEKNEKLAKELQEALAAKKEALAAKKEAQKACDQTIASHQIRLAEKDQAFAELSAKVKALQEALDHFQPQKAPVAAVVDANPGTQAEQAGSLRPIVEPGYDAVLDFDLADPTKWTIDDLKDICLDGKALAVLGNYCAGKTFFMRLLTGEEFPDEGDTLHTVGLSLKATEPFKKASSRAEGWEPGEKIVVLDTAGRNAPVSFHAAAAEEKWTRDFLDLQREQDEFYRDLALTMSNMCFMVVNKITQEDVKYIFDIARGAETQKIFVVHNFRDVRSPEELLEHWQMVYKCFRPIPGIECPKPSLDRLTKDGKILPFWCVSGDKQNDKENLQFHIALVNHNRSWGGRYNAAVMAKIRSMVRHSVTQQTKVTGNYRNNEDFICHSLSLVLDRYFHFSKVSWQNENGERKVLVVDKSNLPVTAAARSQSGARDRKLDDKPSYNIWRSNGTQTVPVIAMRKSRKQSKPPQWQPGTAELLAKAFPDANLKELALEIKATPQDVDHARYLMSHSKEELALRLGQLERPFSRCMEKPRLVEINSPSFVIDVCARGPCAAYDIDIKQVPEKAPGHSRVSITGVTKAVPGLPDERGMREGTFTQEFNVPKDYPLKGAVIGTDDTGSVWRIVFPQQVQSMKL